MARSAAAAPVGRPPGKTTSAKTSTTKKKPTTRKTATSTASTHTTKAHTASKTSTAGGRTAATKSSTTASTAATKQRLSSRHPTTSTTSSRRHFSSFADPHHVADSEVRQQNQVAQDKLQEHNTAELNLRMQQKYGRVKDDPHVETGSCSVVYGDCVGTDAQILDEFKIPLKHHHSPLQSSTTSSSTTTTTNSPLHTQKRQNHINNSHFAPVRVQFRQITDNSRDQSSQRRNVQQLNDDLHTVSGTCSPVFGDCVGNDKQVIDEIVNVAKSTGMTTETETISVTAYRHGDVNNNANNHLEQDKFQKDYNLSSFVNERNPSSSTTSSSTTSSTKTTNKNPDYAYGNQHVSGLPGDQHHKRHYSALTNVNFDLNEDEGGVFNAKSMRDGQWSLKSFNRLHTNGTLNPKFRKMRTFATQATQHNNTMNQSPTSTDASSRGGWAINNKDQHDVNTMSGSGGSDNAATIMGSNPFTASLSNTPSKRHDKMPSGRNVKKEEGNEDRFSPQYKASEKPEQRVMSSKASDTGKKDANSYNYGYKGYKDFENPQPGSASGFSSY